MGSRIRDGLEKAAVLAVWVLCATFVVSAWQAGWPPDELQMQPWAIAIAIPAFLVVLAGSIAASAEAPAASEGDEGDKD
jgi:hypothetical protein